MTEVWKDVPGYEGAYQVSNTGKVRSLNWRNTGGVRNLYLKPHNRGYLQVELAKKGVRRGYVVHRLVAAAFIENPLNLPNVNHKDENKKNNSAENLEWCSQSYNTKYSADKHPERKLNGMAKNTGCRYKQVTSARPVQQISRNGEVIKTWDCPRTIYHETGMSDWSIAECCRGNRKTAYGYVWRYAN